MLLLFSLYMRTRRTLTYQKASRTLLVTRSILFALVAVLLLSGATLHPILFLYAVLGLVIGFLLAYLALRGTRFEQRQDGVYYRANPWIGMVVIALFVFRFAYRYIELYQKIRQSELLHNVKPSALSTTSDPLTFFLFYLVIAYYLGYYVFLLFRLRRFSKEKAAEQELVLREEIDKP
ncbi:Protein of unknown function [Alicyclobacillus tolerans]|uniref:DUF1453 domain-containing protein n=1 Tax=Alicyclobacillus tolerans TaxID=90970 RepID=A0A1M6M032_9BACL|nr:Protein of unknown function [Alicyclobacillus montanus]